MSTKQMWFQRLIHWLKPKSVRFHLLGSVRGESSFKAVSLFSLTIGIFNLHQWFVRAVPPQFREQRTKTIGVHFCGNVLQKPPRGCLCRNLSWHSATSTDGATWFCPAVWRQCLLTRETYFLFFFFIFLGFHWFLDLQSEVFANRALVGPDVAVVLFQTSHYSKTELPFGLNGSPPALMLSVPPKALLLFCTYGKPRVSWINCEQLITEIRSLRADVAPSRRL